MRQKILVNMKEVATIDSSGVGELVGCYTTATHKGAKLKLVSLPPKISDVLTVTQLITVFDVYDSEADAIAPSARGRWEGAGRSVALLRREWRASGLPS